MFVLDSHCDTPSQILRLRDLGLWNSHAQVDFPKMKAGGVDGAFFALYVPASLAPAEATAHALKLLAGVQDSVEAHPEMAAIVTNRQEAFAAKLRGQLAVFLGIENGSAIQDSLSLLRFFFRAGVRYMTLSHSEHNGICDSCAPAVPRWGGLSPFGREVVREMNRLGMLVDVSHISDAAFYDVLECSSSPVVASHSCCRALSDHKRNLSDDMIRALAAQGGVIQINFYPVFLDATFVAISTVAEALNAADRVEAEFIRDPSDSARRMAWYEAQDGLRSLRRPSYKLVADHVDHVVSLVGVEHVGLGSDFDGIAVTPEGLEDISCFGLVLEELRSRGYSEDEVAKIAGGNFLRLI